MLLYKKLLLMTFGTTLVQKRWELLLDVTLKPQADYRLCTADRRMATANLILVQVPHCWIKTFTPVHCTGPYQTNAESQVNPTNQSPSGEADIRLASQEIFRLSNNTKIHHRVYNGQQLVNILSHPNSFHTLHPISLAAIFLLSSNLRPSAECGTFPSDWD